MGRIQEFCVNEPKLQNTCFFCWKYSCPCKTGTTTYVQLHQPKKVTSRGRGGTSSKIKFKGLDLFWLNTCGWSSKVGPTGKKSHHQANHPQIGHDGTNSRILWSTRRPKLQNTCFFLLKIQLSLQKGTDTHVQLHQPKKWLEEAEAQVSKIKSKGLDLFLWLNTCGIIFKGWPHRKKIASPGQSSTDRTWWDEFKNFVSTSPNCKTHGVVFFAENTVVLAKTGTTTYVQLHQPKKVTSRGRGAGVKNKVQGAGPFLTEYLRMIFKGWPHRKKVASPGQSSTDRTWWDEFKNFVPTCGQIAKQAFFSWRYICPCKRVVHCRGHLPDRTREAVDSEKLRAVRKSGARNSFFSVSDWGGEDMACYQRKHPGNIFLGYERGKFIGCWTLGTTKLAKKIQKGDWKWDFGFRG